MKEEESIKRNTDCVYFLASPLTCKKGFECEYRHSEVARLNPRECWYWLSGGCLNPTCAFRHPPLDGLTIDASDRAASSIPVNKANVPCHYYFKGFCNKGERCSFLHNTNTGSTQCGKLVKTNSANSVALQLENNSLAGSNLGSAPTTKVEADAKIKPKQEFQIPVLEEKPRQSSSQQISFSDEETATVRSFTLSPTPRFVHSVSYPHKNHSSDEQEYEKIDRAEIDRVEIYEEEIEIERWESAPGFDVLDDGESENLDSEDGQEYIIELHGRTRELNDHFSGYDIENPVEYIPNYHHNHYAKEDVFGDVKSVQCQSRVRISDSDLGFDDRREFYLRDHLRSQSFVVGHSFPGFSRTHKPRRLLGRTQEQSRQHGTDHRHRNRRLAFEPLRVIGPSNAKRHDSYPRHSKQYRSKKQRKERENAKRQRLLTEISVERRSTHEPMAFSGPKTLAELKEEKRKAQENGGFSETKDHHSRKTLADFKGPRPLSEILKDKVKL